jgi:excisionase family DNA binding protein
VQANISPAGVQDVASRLEHSKGLLTVRELQTYLNLSKTTLYDKVQQGTIPYLRFGTTIRFDPVRIAIWLREQEVCRDLPTAA